MSWVLLALAIVLQVAGTTKHEALSGCLGYARGSCRYRVVARRSCPLRARSDRSVR
jgi:hypothetical protein